VNPATIRDKIAYIFLPLVLLAVAFAGVYSLANWILVADSGLVPIDQDLANLWLPIALGVILVGTLIAPRLRVLKLSEKRNIAFLYQMIAMAVVIAPACIAQHYVATASGGLTQVKSADMIASAPRTKYYAASTVCIDRQNALIDREATISGRNDEYLDFKIYVLVPVCTPAQQSVWIGVTYGTSTDNSASDELKQAAYRDFAERAQKQFENFDPSSIQYFELLGRSTDRRNFEKALPHGVVTPKYSPIILISHLNSFATRSGETLPWVFYSFGIAASVFLIMLLIPGVDSKRLAEARKPRGERRASEPSIWLAFIVPHRDAFGLPILIDVNLAVYLAMVFSGLGVLSFQVDDLRVWGADYGPALHGFGYYRLITSQFLHGGIMHILGNMYGLAIGGLFLSPVIRKAGLILAYLVCGLGGSLASMAMHPEITSFGASGAIMGLWGILLVLALLGDKRVVAGRGPIVVNCLIFAGLTLAQGAVISGIDNAAHVGGLVTGAVVGVLIFLFSWGEKLEVRADPEKVVGL
jgi:rhomboid protease GluP